MSDYKEAKKCLYTLHEATINIPGYFKRQAAEFIDVGEYGLALDTIAGAYLDNNLSLPPDLFAIFEALANEMELEKDPEYSSVAELRHAQAAAASRANKLE